MNDIDALNIFGIKKQINKRIGKMDYTSNNFYSSTFECIIERINKDGLSVDVSLKFNSKVIKNVFIGTNVYGDINIKTSLKKGQKGIVLLSSQHGPVLISLICSDFQKKSEHISENEFLLGNNNAGIYKYSDDNFELSSDNTSILMGNNLDVLSGSVSLNLVNETNEEVTFDNILENEEEILRKNSELISKTYFLIEDIKEFIYSIDWSDISSEKQINDFFDKINSDDVDSIKISNNDGRINVLLNNKPLIYSDIKRSDGYEE